MDTAVGSQTGSSAEDEYASMTLLFNKYENFFDKKTYINIMEIKNTKDEAYYLVQFFQTLKAF